MSRKGLFAQGWAVRPAPGYERCKSAAGTQRAELVGETLFGYFFVFEKVTRTARDWLRKKPWMARHTRKEKEKEKEKNINQQNYPQ